ncbi:MAG TPA: FAD-dependent oxidoreductase [Actinomycetes bacterium]|nr:FAD-dependent oxidoreductase [Actinomycetes bacterium]
MLLDHEVKLVDVLVVGQMALQHGPQVVVLPQPFALYHWVLRFTPLLATVAGPLPTELERLLAVSAERARERAAPLMDRVREAVGLGFTVPRPWTERVATGRPPGPRRWRMLATGGRVGGGPMPMPIRYVPALPRGAELVIIGGGIVGAATAFYASRAGLRPLLLERRPALCSLTTAVAAGGCRLQLETEEQLRLVRESAELFADFAEVTGQAEYGGGLRRQGYLWLTTSEDGAERQRRLVAAQRGWGVSGVELLSGDEARRVFPFVGPRVVQARFRADDGLLDPKGVTMGLVAASGARVAVGCGVVGLHQRAGGGRVEVETTRGRLGADTVVVAAGPFSGEVARLAGVDLPVSTVRRQKLVLPEVPQVPASAPMTIDDDTGVHWRPAFRGAALLFADPTTPPSPPNDDVPLDHRFAFQLLDPSSPVSAARVTPLWREVWERWSAPWLLQAGHYTMTPDRRPLIGHTAVEGLLVNSGYSGRGVMAGPAGSRHLVDLLTGKVPASDNPFRPDRRFAERPRVDIL